MSDGIEKIDSDESIVDEIESDSEPESEIESTEENTKSIKELAREKLQQKLDTGFDLAEKDEKSRICHEIANEISNITGSCSYQAVAKEVKYVLKAKKQEKSEPETRTVEGNTIIKKGIDKVNRPARKIVDESTESPEQTQEELFAKFQELQKNNGDSFEALSIKFALEDVSFLISALGLPKPQTKLLEQRAKQIASYNNLQRSKGNHENVIEVSDKILRYAIYLGLLSTFAQPIIKKYFPKNSKSKSGIETKNKSLRD